MSYSEKIRELRGKETQESVADAIGVSVSSYRKYENGERKPSDDIKVKLAKHFGKTVQYIFF